MKIRKHKNKIYSLDDVRNWRELKKDELDLEKLKFYAEKEQLKSEFAKGVGKIFLYEGLLLAGQKIIMTILKSLLNPSEKKKKTSQEKIDVENSDS